jgi:hypothetical protein
MIIRVINEYINTTFVYFISVYTYSTLTIHLLYTYYTLTIHLLYTYYGFRGRFFFSGGTIEFIVILIGPNHFGALFYIKRPKFASRW